MRETENKRWSGERGREGRSEGETGEGEGRTEGETEKDGVSDEGRET